MAGPSDLERVLHPLLFGSLDNRIRRACQLYLRIERCPCYLEPLEAALAELNRRLDALNALMDSLAIPSLCSECGRRPAGGCCSAEMAEEVDGLLLLANLHAGIKLDIPALDPTECRFLGKGGCTLRHKPIFCLGYYCRDLRETLGNAMTAVEAETARYLYQYLEVERHLTAWLEGG